MIWRFWLWDKTVRKFEELPIHCQRYLTYYCNVCKLVNYYVLIVNTGSLINPYYVIMAFSEL